ALATQVLPDAQSRGKDLGIMNIASAVPQAIAPLLGAFIVAALVGFQGLFILAASVALLGALAVLPIKGVRGPSSLSNDPRSQPGNGRPSTGRHSRRRPPSSSRHSG